MLPCHGSHLLRRPSATLSPITTPSFQFTSVLPELDSATDHRSNPIAHRVRAANTSGFLLVSLSKTPRIDTSSAPKVCPEAFPIKASDNPGVGPSMSTRAFLGNNPGNKLS